MKVKIYRPSKNVMQSGKAKTKKWLLEFESENTKFIDPIMGWTGNSDMKQELKLWFASSEEAVEYAKNKKLNYRVIEPKQAQLKKQIYANNFI